MQFKMDQDEDQGERAMGFKLQCTMENWNTEFKEAFKEFCLTQGEAGEIIIRGVNIEMEQPDFHEMAWVNIPEDQRQEGQPIRVRGEARLYPGSSLGYSMFLSEDRRYRNLREGRRRILSKLLTSMVKEVKSRVVTSEGYAAAAGNYDILTVWNLLEQVVQGRGAMSVISLTVRLLRLKQSGGISEYIKEFKEITHDLLAVNANREVILNKLFDTLFLLGCDQEQFKEVLTPWYGERDWPERDQAMLRLHQYAEATQHLTKFKKNNNGGEIMAHLADNSNSQTINQTKECYRCGKIGHISPECRSAPHKCTICGVTGHIEKMCRSQSKSSSKTPVNSATVQKFTSKSSNKKYGKDEKNMKESKLTKKKGGKLDRSTLKKIFANLASQLNDEDEEEEDEEEESGNEEEDIYDCEPEYVCTVKENKEDLVEEAQVTSYLSRADVKESFILDTGCRGAHIAATPNLLHKVESCTTASVSGITGHELRSTHSGCLPIEGISSQAGRTIVIPGADANLISIKSLLKEGGSFKGNNNELTIFDGNNNIIVTGRDHGDGYWRCSAKDLVKSSISAYAARHFSAEEVQRAIEARELCRASGHIGFNNLIRQLDSGNYEQCRLTSQDVRNAEALYGPCLACLEAKMRRDPEKPSDSPPAYEIGEKLHADLIILSETSLAGNNFILVIVDEKTGYLWGIPLKHKTSALIYEGLKLVLAELTGFGYKPKSLTTDDENCFRRLHDSMSLLGIRFSTTPAGLHEKRVERYIQSIKGRKRAMLASLHYELPAELEAEAYMSAIALWNRSPNKQSGQVTPYQIVKRRKPILPEYYFGQTGVFHLLRKKEENDRRSEWGIFIGIGEVNNYLRAYVPHRKHVFSMRKFVPNDNVPSEWNFKPRIRPRDPASRRRGTTADIPNILLPTAAVMPKQSKIPSSMSEFSDQEGADQEGVKKTQSETPPIHATFQPTPQPPPLHATFQPTTPPQPILQPSCQPTAPQESEAYQEGVPTPTAIETIETLPPSISETPQVSASESIVVSDQPNSNKQPLSQATNSRPMREARKLNWRDGPSLDRPIDRTSKTSKKKAYITNLRFQKIIANPHGPFHTEAHRITIRRALQMKERREETVKSITSEIENIVNSGGLLPIMFSDIPAKDRKDVIPAFMFLKDKYLSDGTFDKMKSRMVTEGNQQNPDTIGDTYSPTVNPMSVMVQLNLAAENKDTSIGAYDVISGFLNTPVRPGRRIFVKVRSDVATFWIQRYPEMKKYLHTDGCLYFELTKFLYGLAEAPHQFNLYLDSKLKEIGFEPTKADPCLYTLKTEDGLSLLSTHVDDMLVTAPNTETRNWIEEQLERHFKLVKQHDNVSYLGMSIKRSEDGGITVDQSGYVQKILEQYLPNKLRKAPTSPATSSLLEEAECEECDKKYYLSLLMSLMFLARFTRPDILMPVTYLATKCSNPNKKDLTQLNRVLHYLQGCPKKSVNFSPVKIKEVKIFADASHGIHSDGKGHGGIMVTLGSGPIISRSYKLKLTTRSSSESELVVLEEASTYAIWMRCLLDELGHPAGGKPATIYQDNKSTIIMAFKGGSFKRNKHMIIRDSYINERITEGDVKLQYLPSIVMPADILTKPTPPPVLNKLLKLIGLM